MNIIQPTKIVPITKLGECQFSSPLRRARTNGQGIMPFVTDDQYIRETGEVRIDRENDEEFLFERAGSREKLFFDPVKTRAAIVTCGGLCPGLNDVIRSIYLELRENYGIAEVLGIRFGYQGLDPRIGQEPIVMTHQFVSMIHHQGGTFLGSSRGERDLKTMVDFLVNRQIDILYCIGGDGTQRGAHAIVEEIAKRGLKIAVVGVPKTIDNDILYCDRTFGLITAIEKSTQVIQSAHVEAKGTPRGIGLVKLMGRDAGFIACGATLASQEADYCLIPESPFDLHGPTGVLAVLQHRMDTHGHAVVVVAEGAGQHLFDCDEGGYDASGNRKYQDIGVLMKDRIIEHFKSVNHPVEVKYIDPSYIIRSAPANTDDRLLCDQLARHAAHAGMSGRTDCLIGYKNGKCIHLPIGMAVAHKQKVDLEGPIWASVLATTGQPIRFGE